VHKSATCCGVLGGFDLDMVHPSRGGTANAETGLKKGISAGEAADRGLGTDEGFI
jgi:hypothetical protein